MSTLPDCNYVEFLQGTGAATISTNAWNLSKNMQVPVGICFPLPGDGTKFAKLLCKDGNDDVTTTKDAVVKAYEYADKDACEADTAGASDKEFTTGPDKAIGGIVKGGASNTGMCDAPACVPGTDYFLARRTGSVQGSCDDAKFDAGGKDWYIQFTECHFWMTGTKYECHGVGGITQITSTDCSSSSAGSPTNYEKGVCEGSVKYETDCGIGGGGGGKAGANSLSGKVIVGLMAAFLTAIVMI